MAEFLRQLARKYGADGSPDRLCFIFPNKRATVFFGKYLSEELKEQGRTSRAPAYFTMNDFFYRITGGHKADRILQLLRLYDCYSRLVKNPEPLDDFLYWGGVMLADFGDVDKYLADPEKLWKNVEEFKDMQDLSFLSEDQRAAILEFIGHFDGRGEVKKDFLRIWNILLPLYRSFNESLAAEGLSYEGMIYRTLAAQLDRESVTDILARSFSPGTRFVFAGLGALNECEKKLLSRMKDAGIADFCWDWASPEIRDPENKSSFFMARNVERFGQDLETGSSGLQRPEINILSVPSSIGQAKQLPCILERLGGPHDMRTAIVLPDEGLLVPVLNSIPAEIGKINVTMGYPMKGSEWLGLLSLTGALQLGIRDTGNGPAFYHRQVRGIFSNGVFRSAISPEEEKMVEDIKAGGKFYIPAAEFASGGLLQAIFCKAEDKAAYLRNVILEIARAIREDKSRAMELEFAMHSYQAVTRLQELAPPVADKTWWKLLWQLLATDTVPFKGEPLEGMQIMGPLETRTLDFDNLVILSCNEGVFPRKSVAPSFIPPELRKGFGLPTYEYQDSIWAYYFYRLIQRARKVWLVFDSRTEGIRSGEESRYIKQLGLIYGFKLNRYVVSSPVKGLGIPDSIPKTEEDLAVLASPGFHLSASSMRQYLNCPAAFLYGSVKGLKEPDEVEENLDAGMLGNVLHAVMHALYSSNPEEPEEKKLKALDAVSRSLLQALLKDKDGLRAQVRMRIRLQLGGAPDVTGRNLVYEEIICRYAAQILRRDLELLERKNLPSFKIIGLEQFRDCTIGGFRFIGYIDRLDSFEPGTVRIVDYKTGHVEDSEMEITDENAGKVLDALFGKDNSKRPGIALQLYLYDRLMEGAAGGKVLLNSIYQTQRLFVEEVRTSRLSRVFCEGLEPRLLEKLDEIRNPEEPWRRTPNPDDCKWCDFKNICGR